MPPGFYLAWEMNPMNTIQNIRTQASSHSSTSLRFPAESFFPLAIIVMPPFPQV
jgi:hypothetical protein